MDGHDGGEADATKGGPPPLSDDSIKATVERLIASGKDLAEAELSWARLKGKRLGKLLRRSLFFGSIAIVCLTIGLILLLVDGVVALVPMVGLFFAVLIVAVIAFVMAATFGLIARRALDRLLEGDE